MHWFPVPMDPATEVTMTSIPWQMPCCQKVLRCLWVQKCRIFPMPLCTRNLGWKRDVNNMLGSCVNVCITYEYVYIYTYLACCFMKTRYFQCCSSDKKDANDCRYDVSTWMGNEERQQNVWGQYICWFLFWDIRWHTIINWWYCWWKKACITWDV